MFLPTLNGPSLKIGIIRSSSIGDVVLATACIDLLMKLTSNIEITWVGKKPSIDLLRSAYPNLKFIELKKSSDLSKGSKIASELGSVHFIIDLQGSIRSRMLCHNIKKTHNTPSFYYDKAQIFRTKLIAEARLFGRNRVLPAHGKTPQKRQFQSMCDALIKGLRNQLPSDMLDGLANIKATPHLPTSHDQHHRPWQKELQFGYWLAIAPGASHQTKKAPLSVFVKIIQAITKELARKETEQKSSIGLLILGDQDDRKVGISLTDELAWDGPLLNLAGKLSLWETALALKDAEFLLSNDSGLGHISEAVDTPVGILFGPTVEGFGFAPHLNDSQSFSTSLGCRPCSKHGKNNCRFNDMLCFTSIIVADAANYISEYLKKNIADDQIKKTATEPTTPSASEPPLHV